MCLSSRLRVSSGCPSSDSALVCVDTSARPLCEGQILLSEDRCGEGPAPRGGVQVADARGHAPTLGQTRKRWRRP